MSACPRAGMGSKRSREFGRSFPICRWSFAPLIPDYLWDEISKIIGNTDQMLVLKKPFDNVEVLQMAHALARNGSSPRLLVDRWKTLRRWSMSAPRTFALPMTHSSSEVAGADNGRGLPCATRRKDFRRRSMAVLFRWRSGAWTSVVTWMLTPVSITLLDVSSRRGPRRRRALSWTDPEIDAGDRGGAWQLPIDAGDARIDSNSTGETRELPSHRASAQAWQCSVSAPDLAGRDCQSTVGKPNCARRKRWRP